MNDTKFKNLEKYRKLFNLSQKELADRIDVKRYQIADWEQGRSEPSFNNLMKLSQVFGVSLDELLDNTFIDVNKCMSEDILTKIKK